MSARSNLVVFDGGGVLVDETRMWVVWTDLLDVSRATFLMEFEAVIKERLHHHEVFELLAPEADIAALALHVPYRIEPRDLYPDAAPALRMLRERGARMAVAANQPAQSRAALLETGLKLEFIVISEIAGLARPQREFFTPIAETADLDPSGIAYVGDRLDNDILPARQAGVVSTFILRDPWGACHKSWREADEADVVIENLHDLAALFAN